MLIGACPNPRPRTGHSTTFHSAWRAPDSQSIPQDGKVSPLLQACLAKNFDSVRILVEAKADVNFSADVGSLNYFLVAIKCFVDEASPFDPT